MKRLITFILFAQFILILSAQQKIGKICYNLNEETLTAEVTENVDEFYEGNIIIPETVDYEGKSYTVTSIADFAMYDCQNVIQVDFPETIISIGQYAFENCYILNEVKLPSKLQKLGEHAFAECHAITEITLPGSLKEIGDGVFSGCKELALANILEGVPYISSSMFGGCKLISSISIPSSVSRIEDWAFSDCSSLKEIIFSKGLVKIGECAFAFCSSVETLSLPESLDVIANKAFANCDKLSVVQFPSTLSTIGDAIFDTCEKLAAIKCSGTVPPIFTSERLMDFCDFTILYVPKGLKDTYAASEVWKEFKEIREYSTNEVINDRLHLTVQDDLCFIICPFLKEAKVTKRGIEDFYVGAPVIPNYVSYNGEEYKVTCIGNGAFERCFQLTDITIPNSVQHISDWAFAGCQYLEKLILPENLKSIGRTAFFSCAMLKEITLPKTLETIGDEAFQACVSLKRVFSNLNEPIEISESVFDFNYPENNLTLYVPLQTSEKYRNAPVWNLFPEIMESGQLQVQNPTTTLQNGEMLYSIDGKRATNPRKGIYIQNGKKVLLP